MTFQGNYIDLILIILLIVWIADGWERGFFHLITDLVSFLGSFVFGLRYYSRAAYIFISYFSISRGIANALGFLLVYTAAHAILALLLVGLLRGIPEKYFPRLWQKFMGIFPAFVNGVVIIAVVLTLAVSLPIRTDVKDVITKSQIGSFLIRRTGTLERGMDSVFGEAIQESMAFLTVEPSGTERVNLGFELNEPDFSVDEYSEAAMFALVNQERAKQGIMELSWDTAIVPVARAHAKDMFERGYFSHVSPEGEDVGDRLQEADIRFFVAGENLALAPSLAMAHDGLMQSSGHRENFLSSDFSKVGIGVIDGGRYGKMFVQVFTD